MDQHEHDPSPDDLDDLSETLIGKPLKQNAREAAARIQRQLDQAREDLALLDRQSGSDSGPSGSDSGSGGQSGSDFAKKLRLEIRDLELRLLEYKHQLNAGKN